MNEARFWRDFLEWHTRTDHAWDTRLFIEATNGYIDEMAREIGERLLPAVQKAADAIRAILQPPAADWGAP